MTNAHVLAAIIAIGLSLTIFYLVRKDHIVPKVAARWFFVSVVVLVLGLAPELVDKLGLQLGIGYPPIIPVLFALCVAAVKVLLMDIEMQKLNTRLERMIQKSAMLEAEVDQLKTNDSNDQTEVSEKLDEAEIMEVKELANVSDIKEKSEISKQAGSN